MCQGVGSTHAALAAAKELTVTGPSDAFIQLFMSLGILFSALLIFLFQWSLVIAWLAWWLFAADWRKIWPVLARGAWLPTVLLMVLAALAWSQMRPRDLNIGGEFSLPNFWWQLIAIFLLAGLTLLCGWLQENFGWYSTEVEIEPPIEASHAHAHH